MADEPKTPEIDDELLLTEDDQVGGPGPDDHDDGEGGEEEEVPTFGDTADEVQETDNATIRHLREQVKLARKEAAEARKAAGPAKPIEVGPEPSLWDEGIDGDEEKLKSALRDHDKQVEKANEQRQAVTDTTEQQNRRLADRLEKVATQKAALNRPDADEAFETLGASLGEAKAAGIVGILDDSTNGAAFLYALSKNPEQLAALAAENDPVRLVKAITKLEGQLKMVKKRTPPAPDEPVRGSGRASHQTTDKKLEKLEKEADRTGDRSEVVAYKKALKKAAK